MTNILQQLQLSPFDAQQKPLTDISLHKNRNQYALDAKGQWLGLHLHGEQHQTATIAQLLQQPQAATLQYLHISETNLQNLQIPPLPQLIVLDLSENQQLQSLQFANSLPNLQTLIVHNCKLSALNLPAGCNKLQTLIAYNNPLNQVQIQGNCPMLRRVELHENKNLQNLQMPSNLQALQEVYLDATDRLQNIPPEILKQGAKGVAVYFKSLAKGQTDVYEVKMLIVGEGETGKTTLWKKLQDPTYMPSGKEESTVGIQIREGWSFKHTDKKEVDCLVNMWDFGGQEIQYMTHQFFLTPRSLYVLLADGRREVANFPYWLKIINLLGRTNDKERVPVLVILNEKGSTNVKAPYDEESVIIDFPNLKITKRQVDFAINDGRFGTVQTLIEQSICQDLAHLPITMPSNWQEVREALYELRKTHNHINEEKYTSICKEKGIGDTLERNTLLLLLRDLGIILYYDNIDLADFIVLNPVWALDAVYEILRHKEVGQNKGRFNEKLLMQVWTQCKYLAPEQAKLLQLMLKDNLEVCFKATENDKTVYIAPQLLEYVPRPQNIKHDNPADLSFIYQYPFMPKGIIGRLMVRLNKQIMRRNDELLVWNKGMLLQIEDCEVLVEEAEDTAASGLKTITINVRKGDAENRKNALRDVRKKIDEIHLTFQALKVEEKIPCICERCKNTTDKYFYPFTVLMEAQKIASQIQCQKSFKYLDVHTLLGASFPANDPKNVIAQTIDAMTKNKIAEAFELLQKAGLENDTINQLREEYTQGIKTTDFNGRFRLTVLDLADRQNKSELIIDTPSLKDIPTTTTQETEQPWWKKLWVKISAIIITILTVVQLFTGCLSNIAGFFNDAFGLQIGKFWTPDSSSLPPANALPAINDSIKTDSSNIIGQPKNH